MLTLGYDYWDRGLSGHGKKSHSKFRDMHYYPHQMDLHHMRHYDQNAFVHVNHVWSTYDDEYKRNWDNGTNRNDRKYSNQRSEVPYKHENQSRRKGDHKEGGKKNKYSSNGNVYQNGLPADYRRISHGETDRQVYKKYECEFVKAYNWAVTWDFQQFDILASVNSDEPLQPPFKLRNSKWCSVSSLTIIEYSRDKQRLWSDSAYAQADLRLCWSHKPHCWKSHALAQLNS